MCKYMFFWFYRSVGIEGNIKFAKKGDSFHFCSVTNESDGAIIQFVDQVMWCLQ